MAIDIGQMVDWRFQGLKSCCWLTAIEMMMQCKYKCIYGEENGRPRTAHSGDAMSDFKKNEGAHVSDHAAHYNLRTNETLKNNNDIRVWEEALRRGPVLAEGMYGLSRMGWGAHVIVIAGVSASKKLAYYNPNIFAFFLHTKSKLTYFTVERCLELADPGYMDGPFWQVAEDLI